MNASVPRTKKIRKEGVGGNREVNKTTTTDLSAPPSLWLPFDGGSRHGGSHYSSAIYSMFLESYGNYWRYSQAQCVSEESG